MQFSVIIPSKDRPHLLDRALRSLSKQSFRDFEVIVVDDGAGAALDIAEMHGEKDALTIKAVSSGQAGQVIARRMGLEQAKGRFIAWLDDDDWWEPDYLAQMNAQAAPDLVGYASGWIAYETEAGLPLRTLPFDSFASPDSLRKNNTLLLSGLVYAANWHERLGAFDASLAYYWDWDWYLRLAAGGAQFVSVQGRPVWISAREGSVSSAQNEAARRAELDRLQNKHGLEPIPLKNHASIAADQAAAREVDFHGSRA